MPTKIEWTQETESWKNINGFDDYRVSNRGRIYSEKTDRLLAPMSNESGHLYVYLYDGHGNSKKVFVHHAVLNTFVGQRKEGMECRHLNGNPQDNSLNNLRWGTRKQNSNDRWRHGTMPIPHKSEFTKLNPKDIPKIRKMKGQKSSRKVAELFKTSHTTIQKIWRNERWKGY